jgi:hypothetical protein
LRPWKAADVDGRMGKKRQELRLEVTAADRRSWHRPTRLKPCTSRGALWTMHAILDASSVLKHLILVITHSIETVQPNTTSGNLFLVSDVIPAAGTSMMHLRSASSSVLSFQLSSTQLMLTIRGTGLRLYQVSVSIGSAKTSELTLQFACGSRMLTSCR